MSKLSNEELQHVRMLAQARREQDRKGWTVLEVTLWNRLAEAEALIVQAQDALGINHQVWWLLDDYDGSMDSVKRMKQFIRSATDLLALAEQKIPGTDNTWHYLLKAHREDWESKGGYVGEWSEGVSRDAFDAPSVQQ